MATNVALALVGQDCASLAAIIQAEMMTEDQVREALRDCYDPEIPLNIIELGMVAAVGLSLDVDAPGAGIAGVPARYSAVVTLLAAERDEGLGMQRAAVVHNRLAGIPELSRISVQFAERPVWTPGLITVAGRRTLGLDWPMFPILNNRVR